MKGKGNDRAARLRIAGTMSGTSLDGIDLAVIETDGREILDLGETRYRAYSADERATIREALGTWPGDRRAEAAARVVEAAHAQVCEGLEGIDAIGFHGQTLAHDPGERRTHQAGDGARLAAATRCQVIWDFRSTDMEMGGQGAPLAPFYHWACARRIGAGGPVAFLNLGGVGNLTWTDPAAEAPEAPGACVAFDTGPANAPIDDVMRARGLGDYDAGGALAKAGRVERDIVQAALGARYFARMPPKSLDRNDFADLFDVLAPLPDADAVATLVAIAVAAVARGMAHLPEPPAQVLVTGGGRKNAAMMSGLRAALKCPVHAVETVGLDGDFLEAQAFGYLAARVMNGMPTSAPGTTGVAAPVGGGRRSLP
ncbi:anhydro-N-acetylmuramic acid kinase [Roseibacterium sp. SDUM158017]|uniref:anhydro-N-acetylmuramic acid kinase n=1 Tax=Roseicyclus salinarum TaxID=3036773 RepID=UPI002415754E|nr:anhydro-N-acetylmuramic acid kinase [Roseibacterium sp. SDUM158017]MDG4648055.1 anhydro-N-acetylmuramic acid kinase [Roseibacterium sp. SDUM158017]